ncbi:hypothetical protein HY383_01265 [Candidatus Daviesbacteria bacterium]|nr:hypothetical protein [Candidatus Daviesbacteria bacterium]
MRDIVTSLFDKSDDNGKNSGLVVDGFDAQVVENPNGKPRIAVVFQYSNYIYKIQTDNNIKDILIQMLQTFKFGGSRTGVKTYTSKALGFSLEIPARWDVDEQEGSQGESYYNYRNVSFTAPWDNRDLMPFTIYVTHKDYKEWFPDYKENYSISGIPAYRVSPIPGQNASFEDIVFKKGSDTYVIEVFKLRNNDTELEQILSSFKFTN